MTCLRGGRPAARGPRGNQSQGLTPEFEGTIARLVEGRYPDPNGGPILSVPTRAVAIEDSLAGAEAELAS